MLGVDSWVRGWLHRRGIAVIYPQIPLIAHDVHVSKSNSWAPLRPSTIVALILFQKDNVLGWFKHVKCEVINPHTNRGQKIASAAADAALSCFVSMALWSFGQICQTEVIWTHLKTTLGGHENLWLVWRVWRDFQRPHQEREVWKR